MALILSIDTATNYAGVALAEAETVLSFKESDEQKNHASFVQPAIEAVLKSAGINISLVDAIAVTQGPGSYTGLRVGLSSAKGLCYALNKPLILLNTLEVMAYASIENVEAHKDAFLYCPMIDARRMEVFTAVYNADLKSIVEPKALILDESSLANTITEHKIIFSGSGAAKFENLMKGNSNAVFATHMHNIKHVSILAYKAFINNHFADLAYSEPFYLKEFFNPQNKS